MKFKKKNFLKFLLGMIFVFGFFNVAFADTFEVEIENTSLELTGGHVPAIVFGVGDYEKVGDPPDPPDGSPCFVSILNDSEEVNGLIKPDVSSEYTWTLSVSTFGNIQNTQVSRRSLLTWSKTPMLEIIQKNPKATFELYEVKSSMMGDFETLVVPDMSIVSKYEVEAGPSGKKFMIKYTVKNNDFIPLDINKDGRVTYYQDAIMIIRYLFGLDQGESLIGPVVSQTNPRIVNGQFSCNSESFEIITDDSLFRDSETIALYIERLQGSGVLDIDKNGEADALTDGLLILRYLYEKAADKPFNVGLEEDTEWSLTDNAVDIVNSEYANYSETDRENQIRANIQLLLGYNGRKRTRARAVSQLSFIGPEVLKESSGRKKSWGIGKDWSFYANLSCYFWGEGSKEISNCYYTIDGVNYHKFDKSDISYEYSFSWENQGKDYFYVAREIKTTNWDIIWAVYKKNPNFKVFIDRLPPIESLRLFR